MCKQAAQVPVIFEPRCSKILLGKQSQFAVREIPPLSLNIQIYICDSHTKQTIEKDPTYTACKIKTLH